MKKKISILIAFIVVFSTICTFILFSCNNKKENKQQEINNQQQIKAQKKEQEEVPKTPEITVPSATEEEKDKINALDIYKVDENKNITYNDLINRFKELKDIPYDKQNKSIELKGHKQAVLDARGLCREYYTNNIDDDIPDVFQTASDTHKGFAFNLQQSKPFKQYTFHRLCVTFLLKDIENREKIINALERPETLRETKPVVTNHRIWYIPESLRMYFNDEYKVTYKVVPNIEYQKDMCWFFICSLPRIYDPIMTLDIYNLYMIEYHKKPRGIKKEYIDGKGLYDKGVNNGYYGY